MQFSDRLKPIAHNVFADMDRAKSQVQKHELIDLSLGSSDLPTSPQILQAIAAALDDPSTHGYSLFASTRDFRVTVASWLHRRFGVTVDPETEILPLIGSQEGTAHLPLAILNAGDYALVQNPGYPSHYGGIHLAGGSIYGMPLLAENQFLPVFADIPPAILGAAKMMVLSYPHNPTTAIASLDFFKSAVEFCRHHNLVLVHDFPYMDLVFDRPQPPAILQADPELTNSIEFFTLSKSYNMGGFRVGFAVGNRFLIEALRQVKAVVDFNQYQGIMRGAIAALAMESSDIDKMVATFKQRRDAMIKALAAVGWQISSPAATMYIWAKLPQGFPDSSSFCLHLVQSTGVALSPGAGFGTQGEGYVRFALVQPPEILEIAAQRIGKHLPIA